MRKYETVFISDPDLQDQTRAELFDKVRNIISRENGILLDFDEWGSKKLAYEIKKKLRGYYVCLTYGGTGDLVKELERNFRLSDDIMKFMTLLLSENETAETLEKQAAEIAESKTAEAQPAEETPAEKAPAEKEPVKEEAASEEPAEAADAEEKAAETPAEETAEAVETKE